MDKKPFVTLDQIKEIVKKYPTPFHIYDEKGIRENARLLKKAFAWNKGFKEFFAVKATPNPYILQILKEEGAGVDCSSLTELMMSDKVGFKGKEIMFSSNVTPKEDFALAAKLGAIINFDDLSTLQSLSFSLSRPDSPRSLSPLRRYSNSAFLRSGHPSSRLRPPHPHRQEARPPRGNPRVRRHPGRSEAAARAIRRDPRDAERQLHRRLSERTRGVAQAARRRVSRGNQA